jgi:hypothetical protein
VAFSAGSPRFITAGGFGAFQIWDSATGRLIRALRQEAAINVARLTPNGLIAITAGDDGVARLWDVNRGAEIAAVRGHDEAIVQAELTPDQTRLVTAARDGSLRLTWLAQAETLNDPAWQYRQLAVAWIETMSGASQRLFEGFSQTLKNNKSYSSPFIFPPSIPANQSPQPPKPELLAKSSEPPPSPPSSTQASPPFAARSGTRVALVVGNSNYESVPKLPKPEGDAIAIGQMLRDAHFDNVEVITNVNYQGLKRALRKFEIDSDQADVAVIYYAGHGLDIGGINYLIPVDATLASDRDAEDEAVRLDRVISSADGASKLRVIILDACRDNPFPSLMKQHGKWGRAVTSGLGRTDPTSTDTLIAYAAKAGSTAEDGDGQHSPFTAAILKSLTIPGLDIRLAFGRVKDEVTRVTGSRQEPFVYGSIGGSNFPLVPAPKVQETSEDDVRRDYDLVAKVGTLRAWEVFLNTHKTGFYADLARAQVAALNEQMNKQPAKP